MAHETIGQAIARARKLRGYTQQGLATRVPCSLSIIRKVEQGDRPATPSLIAAVARALQVSITDLTGQPYRGETTSDDRVHALVPQLRREVSAYNMPPTDFDGPLPELATLRERVEETSRLAHDMVVFELGESLPGVLYDLRVLVHTLPESGRREQAFALLATAYENAMMFSYKLGYIDLSSLTVDRYEWAAARSGDPFMANIGDYFRAGEVIVGGEFDSARTFLQDSMRALGNPGDDPVALSVYGNLHLKCALAMARSGNTSATFDHLTEAGQTAQRIGADRDDYRLIFGPTNVKIWEVGMAIELGDPDEAISRSRSADGTAFTPPAAFPAERASHYYIDLARGYSWTGRPADRERSLKYLLAAEKLAPQHTRLHPMTRETVRQLTHLARRSPETLIGLASRVGVRS